MQKMAVNLLDLSDSEKLRVLKEIETYLQEQVAEERHCRTIVPRNEKRSRVQEKISCLFRG